MRTFLPNEIECIEEDDLELFIDSITVANDHQIYDKQLKNAPMNLKILNHRILLEQPRAHDEIRCELLFYDDEGDVKASQPVRIKVYPKVNPSKRKNVLVIGDSLSDANRTLTTLANKCKEQGVTNLHFLGTRGEKGANHEGRGGWNIELYLQAFSEQWQMPNPFWNSGCNDIDFVNYCQQHAYDGFDYVILHLNWNDQIHNPDVMCEHYRQLIRKVHRDFPTCKIFMVGLSSYAYHRYSEHPWDQVRKQTVFDLSEAYERFAQDDPFVEVIHLLHEIDVPQAICYQNVTKNRYSKEEERVVVDHVHFEACGYDQIADVYYRKLMAQIYKDEQ